MTVTNIETASAPVRRQASDHWRLNHVVLDSVFAARDTLNLQEILALNVYRDAGFAKLPQYRVIALEAYLAGALDTMARLTGVALPAISMARPKTVPPKTAKKRKNKSVKPPVMYPSHGIVTPMPSWVKQTGTIMHSPTILPPADLMGAAE